MFNSCPLGEKDTLVYSANFHDIDTPIMANLKLPKWCQLTCKIAENLITGSVSWYKLSQNITDLCTVILLAVVTSEVCESKLFIFYIFLYSLDYFLLCSFIIFDLKNVIQIFLLGLFFFLTKPILLFLTDCNFKLRMSHKSK